MKFVLDKKKFKTLIAERGFESVLEFQKRCKLSYTQLMRLQNPSYGGAMKSVNRILFVLKGVKRDEIFFTIN